MKKILEMNHVQKSFNDNTLHVLKDISLSVSEGEVVSIIGRAGSGKSTAAALRNAADRNGRRRASLRRRVRSQERSQRPLGLFRQGRAEKDPQHFLAWFSRALIFSPITVF